MALLERRISGNIGALFDAGRRARSSVRCLLLLRNHTRATHARLARKREGRRIGIRQEMICVVSPRPAEQCRHDSSSVSRCHEIDSKINPRLRCVRDLQRGRRAFAFRVEGLIRKFLSFFPQKFLSKRALNVTRERYLGNEIFQI